MLLVFVLLMPFVLFRVPPKLKPNCEQFCADELLWILAPEICIAVLIILLAASIAIKRPVPWSSGSPVNVGSLYLTAG